MAGVGVAILLYNVALLFIMRRTLQLGRNRAVMLAHAWAQLLLDVACLTLLSLLTGGPTSPLLGFFVFHMVFASLLLPREMAYAGASLAMVMLAVGLWLSGQWPSGRRDSLLMLGWVATMLIVFPAKWWGYAPPVGYVDIWEDPFKNLEQLYLPAFALGLALSASLARITRSSMLEVLRQDYIRTARAKGLRDRVVVVKHGLKNAMIPVVTLFGLQVGVLFGGTVVLEGIFSLPGLGFLTFQAVTVKDYTQVQGVVLFFATVLVTINLLVDVSYAWFDPRIRYS
jgi:ABC-type dipeptide/oligopeptide/nickel transport system permease subunit